MSIVQVGPSRWYYGLGILIMVVGTAYSVTVFLSFFSDLGGGQQFIAPGSSDLLLAESGEYTIFYESQTTYKGKLFITDERLPLLSIEVENKTTGSKMPIYSPFTTKYTMHGRTGESMCAFRIDQPGIYRVNSSYRGAGRGQEVVLAVSKGFSDGSKVWSNAMLYLGSIILGIALILVTFMMRQKDFKRIKEKEKEESQNLPK
jgi:hypothetical protein